MSESEQYLAKALRSLQGAESEFANKRFDNAANRAYYACFQAALAALSNAGIPIQSDKGGGGQACPWYNFTSGGAKPVFWFAD